MNRLLPDKRRQLLPLVALGLLVGLLALAQASQPVATHDTAAPGPVTAGYWDGPQLPPF
jgi:hypothetical protein